MERFYKASEEVTLRFYQMPKVLFNNPIYKGLSLGAKAVYAILRDRQDLSIKNNWVDEDGYIFLVFDMETLADLLEVTKKTAIKYKKELIEYGLLVDKRLGQGKANRLYVLKAQIHEPIENTLKCKNDTSRSVKNTPLEVSKLPPNDTEVNDTNFIDTQSVPKDGQTELETIIQNAQIYLYKGPDAELLENAINKLLKLKEIKVNDELYTRDHIHKQLYKLTLEACDLALSKFKQAQKEKPIKNKFNYFMVLLLNSIEEVAANNIY